MFLVSPHQRTNPNEPKQHERNQITLSESKWIIRSVSMTEEMCQANDPVIRSACVCVCERDCVCVCVCTNGFGSLHNPMVKMQSASVCVCVTMCLTTLTQHNQVDLAPVVLSPSFDFAGVFPRVGQQQVTDQQGGVSTQVLPSKGQTAGFTARRLIGVHLAPKEGNNLHILKKSEVEIYFNVVYCVQLRHWNTKISWVRCQTPPSTIQRVDQITVAPLPLHVPSSFQKIFLNFHLCNENYRFRCWWCQLIQLSYHLKTSVYLIGGLLLVF